MDIAKNVIYVNSTMKIDIHGIEVLVDVSEHVEPTCETELPTEEYYEQMEAILNKITKKEAE